MSGGAMQSKVGNSQVYNDGDQRMHSTEERTRETFDQTLNTDIHDIHDPKDSLNLSKRAEVEKKMDQQDREREHEPSKYERDPTLAAKEHGNSPSRGARIDAELAEDDRKTLEKKGISAE